MLAGVGGVCRVTQWCLVVEHLMSLTNVLILHKVHVLYSFFQLKQVFYEGKALIVFMRTYVAADGI